MDPKYEGLPGIAHDQPDCYETSDLPEDDQHAANEEKFESEHIEAVHISQRDAFQNFKGKNIDATGLDFSDLISVKRRTGYSTGPTVFEMVGDGNAEPETIEQKFRRLQHEMQELSEQLGQLQKESATESDAKETVEAVTTTDVAALQTQLKQLQVEQVLGDDRKIVSHLTTKKIIEEIAENKKNDSAKDTKTKGSVTYELFSHPDANKTESMKKLSTLESRLQKIETVMEPDSMKLDAIQNVSNKVQLLDLNNLDLIESRLSAVLMKLNQVSAKEQSLGTEETQRVSEVYEMMKKWDTVCAGLPKLVNRLQSLQAIHEQALQFSQALTQLDSVQQQISKTQDTDSALLKEINTNMVENIKSIQGNCENLETRLKALGK